MYNIKERQIQKALKSHKERPNTIELLKKTGINLSKKEIENILIHGDIRGPYPYIDDAPYIPEEYSDYEMLKDLF